ncbi:575_t:CDS:2, partial [Scutellospora calospora]
TEVCDILRQLSNDLPDPWYLGADGHSPSSALYALEDDLHLGAEDKQELVELLMN